MHHKRVAHLHLAKGRGIDGALVTGPRNWIAMRAGGRVSKNVSEGIFNDRANDVLPFASFVMRLCPTETEHVGQKAFGEAVATHYLLGKNHSVVGQRDLAGSVGRHEAFALELTNHFRDGRPGNFEALSNARLFHIETVFAELEDRLAVLLEGRMVLRRLVDHDYETSCPTTTLHTVRLRSGADLGSWLGEMLA